MGKTSSKPPQKPAPKPTPGKKGDRLSEGHDKPPKPIKSDQQK
jgi:hypothetical protein